MSDDLKFSYTLQYRLDPDWYAEHGEEAERLGTPSPAAALRPEWAHERALGEDEAKEAVLARLADAWPTVPAEGWEFVSCTVDEENDDGLLDEDAEFDLDLD